MSESQTFFIQQRKRWASLTFNPLLAVSALLSLSAMGCDDESKTTGGGAEAGAVVSGGEAGEGGEAGAVTSGVMTAGVMMSGVEAGTYGGNVWDMMTPEGGTAGMTGGIEPPAICFEMNAPPEQPSFRLEASCRQGAEPLKVRHIRDPRCPEYMEGPTRAPGLPVSLSSLVVTGVFDDKISLQDQEGGAYSGLWAYSSGRVDLSQLQPGDVVNVEGELIEFFSVTELILSDGGLSVVGNVPPPAPLLVSDSAKIADGGEWTEQLESMLVEVREARVTNTAPDCPQDFGMFVLNMNLRVDPKFEMDLMLGRQDLVSRATGVLHFSFEHHKLLLRDAQDLEVLTCGGAPDKCEASECPVELNEDELGTLVITEIQTNPRGEDEQREYVELYNPNPTEVSLNGWRLQDCAGHTAQLSGTLQGRAHWVLARSLDRNINGGVRAQGEMGELFLPNNYGSLLLFNAEGALVDQVRYAPGGEEGWPYRDPGESLELIEAASDNRLGASWAAARGSYGDGGDGTPGSAF